MVTVSTETIELVVLLGTFYIGIVAFMVPMLRANRKETRQLRTELKTDIGRVEAKVDRLEVKVNEEIGDLRSEMRTELRGTNLRIDQLMHMLTIRQEKVS